MDIHSTSSDSNVEAEVNNTPIDLTLWENFIKNESVTAQEVKSYIHQHDLTKVEPYEPGKNEIQPCKTSKAEEGSDDAGYHPGYLSFGDDGTTATITTRGQHVQISRYLGYGPSGFVSMDHKSMDEPYLGFFRRHTVLGMIEDEIGFGSGVLVGENDYEPSKASWIRNKWPRIVTKGEDRLMVQSYYVKNGVVIQDTVIYNRSNKNLEVTPSVNFDILTRQLEYLDASNSFNEDNETSEWDGTQGAASYTNSAGPGGYGFVQIHRTPSKGRADSDVPYPDAVASVWGFFKNGKVQTKQSFQQAQPFTLEPNMKSRLITGYKLVLLSASVSDWKSLTISAADVDMNSFLRKTQPKERVESVMLQDPSTTSGFSISRIVEHILTVCAIPITRGYVWESGNPAKEEVEAIALTNGEMSFHEVSARESFFAFKLLLEVAKTLKDGDPLKDGDSLKARIKRVCEGHLKWVFTFAKLQETKFAGKYWANGEIIKSLLPDDEPTNTPFQILKLYEYHKTFDSCDESCDHKKIMSYLNGFSPMGWIKSLDKANVRKAYAWRHVCRAGINHFRLDDHIWIYNCLSAISDIENWSDARGKKNPRKNGDEEERERYRLMEMYDPTRVKHEFIKRFTTTYENKQRMIAVMRSPRESRFQFHSKDTALFYPLVDRVFLPSNSAWKATLEAQKRFLSNTDPNFDNLLYHGLCMLMAKEGVSMLQKDQEKSFKQAASFLTENLLGNGLFPTNVEDRWGSRSHHCFQISFEIPYILWSLRDYSPQAKEAQPSTDTSPSTGNPLAENLDPLDGIIPSNRPIDEKSVISVTEEWLYNRPTFFDWKPSTEILRGAGLTQGKSHNPLPVRDMKDNPYHLFFLRIDEHREEVENDTEKESAEVINRAFSDWEKRRQKSDDSYEPLEPEQGQRRSFLLLDVARKKGSERMKSEIKTNAKGTNNIGVGWEQLTQTRREEEVKKRLLWFERPLTDYSLMCYLSAPEAEQSAISTFFQRHTTSLNFFEDTTNQVMNTWETEFHCKFLQIIDHKNSTDGKGSADSKLNGQSDREKQKGCENSNDHKDSRHPEELNDFRELCPMLTSSAYAPFIIEDKALVRASASFRVTGDFFDKFWTFYIVENFPGTQPEHLLYFLGKDSKQLKRALAYSPPKAWQQRNVLEPMLMRRILGEVNRSTRDILGFLEDRIEKDKKNLASRVSDKYFVSLSTWALLHKTLDMLKADLESISTHIDDWNSRERDRKGERPRWTKSDEHKYRHSITAIDILNQRALRVLVGNKARIESLEKSLNFHENRTKNRYDEEMNLRNYQQNQNIKYFTYSTVFFLPLGFGTSIYSMSAPPPPGVIWKMVACAVIAFVVLILAVRLSPYILGSGKAQILKSVESALTPSLSTAVKESEIKPPDNHKEEARPESNREGNRDSPRHEHSRRFSRVFAFMKQRTKKTQADDPENIPPSHTRQEET
ncbi:uncharacterized protein BP01DRAFT_394163 [Aspergillus saccharolyticus JOP 1030-1]|uniref:Mg2+ transporter zinc transport protein n=1 Tax=Aspergillus saccharolyticus JOP 1030-1 TaxID=1450539 RepID=A0A318Z7T3_9EURO|nr:hypothetical protein BP01DRAFT_394163 [Aspergillus saccharolyticus JOP 1030-1]PYH42494.1 hypothetical protein BP01DRAFT_394163 [Aspergillus saccharolyticus JOP 1030-1]